ncbi:hypothetical protein ECHHL_1003 [Ehrlichia chaffeensis str. Heartland]|nr:hypothetical protein ECHHL_1003 [Ehrlichia chaffeensis str. Heartland]AHX06064.1 hypothetical protein ECHJAX_1024 [Ehrlichia chaffeensis str. Jax]AHX08014.1 hypothetical protein ECHOSC_1018 [Ehrlichia chaffeensis str. Osceola]AHX08063.1 hypothetical protein ECHSTV_1006 [Ehrlichia chaffeensis str. Saint Vincent]AHX09621.1 hypothetical protein ECHWAK_1017 [Ehrlichia chaffeensis str. Wakulla]AHX10516.1 hypothetical protein ECHWP_0998 [Ehrlichia chaffeensis str. West Paces]
MLIDISLIFSKSYFCIVKHKICNRYEFFYHMLLRNGFVCCDLEYGYIDLSCE